MRNINAKISAFVTSTFTLELAKSEFRETISKNMTQYVSFKNIENIENIEIKTFFTSFSEE